MGANPHHRIVPLHASVDEAWDSVSDAEGWESGHSYSGNFGSKHGPAQVMVRGDLTEAELRVVQGLIERWGSYRAEPYGDNDPTPDPFDATASTYCDQSEWNATTYRMVPCSKCKGTGQAPQGDVALERRRLADLLGLTPARLDAIEGVYDDKWGPPVAVVGKDHVLFSGWCSS